MSEEIVTNSSLASLTQAQPQAPGYEATLPHPPRSARFWLRVQQYIGHLCVLPFAGAIVVLMHFVRGYRVENMRHVRREFSRHTASSEPMLVCCNHLTFIDSALLIWAFQSNWRYFLNFRRFSWNLPAGDFFKKKFVFRMVAYLAKCVFVHRDGSKQHKDGILGICRWLLTRGQVLTIFPEGRRSRLNRFDREHLTFGAARLVASVPGCRVLCVHLRGYGQDQFSDYPAKNMRFRIQMKMLRPTISGEGRAAYAEITDQIGHTLLGLEREHFEAIRSS